MLSYVECHSSKLTPELPGTPTTTAGHVLLLPSFFDDRIQTSCKEHTSMVRDRLNKAKARAKDLDGGGERYRFVPAWGASNG